jgi:hypothetical protein
MKLGEVGTTASRRFDSAPFEIAESQRVERSRASVASSPRGGVASERNAEPVAADDAQIGQNRPQILG